MDSPRDSLRPGALGHDPSDDDPHDRDRTESAVLGALFGATAQESNPGERYRRIRRLGQGAMGQVELAEDRQLGRLVALKRIGLGAQDREIARARAEREARALAQIKHPNVVSVFDIVEEESGLTLAMEFVEGETLGEWATDRPRVEVLRVLRDAAAGLAAAHANGIVHRDVKPDNILVTATGEARVVDFGLARLDGADAPPGPENTEATLVDSEPGNTVTLTRTGAILGTPAYMAPEQFVSGQVDPRSDQFSFAVTAWEVLDGRRPFGGGSAEDIVRQVLDGNVRPPRRIPSWVSRALRRSLNARPNARLPSMRALAHALDPARRHRRFAIAGFAVLVPAVVVAAVLAERGPLQLPPPNDPCVESVAPASETWSAARAETLTAHFETSAPAYGDAVATRVVGEVDRWSQRWASQARASCEATLVDHTQSAILLDRRGRCLDSALEQLDVTLSGLETLPPDKVSRALSIVDHLPALNPCRDPEAVERAWSLPTDPETAASIGRARGLLAQSRERYRAGSFDEALTFAQRARAELPVDTFLPFDAEHSHRLGTILDAQGKPKEAERALLDATAAAEKASYDRVAAEAWLSLVSLSGRKEGQTERAQFYFERADAAVTRLSDEPLLRGRLHQIKGQVELSAGNLDLAESQFALAEETFSSLGATRARAHVAQDRGRVHYARHNIPAAIAAFTDAVTTYEDGYGATHPRTASARHNLGSMYILEGDIDQAIVSLNAALKTRRAALGDEHPKVGASLNALASAHYSAGRHEEALELYRESLRVHEHGAPEGNVSQAMTIENIGRTLSALDRHDDATAEFDRALAMTLRFVDDDHPRVATILNGLGTAYARAGQDAKARAQYVRALEIRTARLGPQAQGTLIAALNLAEAERDLGLHRKARARIEGILAVEDLRPATALYAKVQLAWLEHAAGKPARARALLAEVETGRGAIGTDPDLDEALEALRTSVGSVPAKLAP